MKAVRCHAWCQPKDLVIEELPRPEPKAGQVLIKVQTAALNFPDVLMIQGLYRLSRRCHLRPDSRCRAR